MQAYHDALIKEIALFDSTYTGTRVLDTLFLGGGTPSTYPSDLLLDTFGILKKMYVFHDTTEVTIEVNPGTVTQARLEAWKKAGINRLSIGVQSLNDEVLKKLNRHQKAQDVLDLMQQAPPLFDNISIDLILGLPEVTAQQWKELIATVMQWPIKHISVYFLTVHEETPLYFKVQTNRVCLPDDEYMVDLYHWTIATLAQHGFGQYELSNFAKPGYESRHNTVYWERKPYKAFGLGASSFDGSQRFTNEKSLMKYIEKVDKGHDVGVFSETVTNEQIYLERLMLGLRRKVGVPIADLIADFSAERQTEILKTVLTLKSNGLLDQQDGRYVLTPAGLVVENEVITQLLQ
jgi:oxygen-independent coproporphyrinogen-3 oxidase